MESTLSTNPEYINRELSWLSFNERVLQEAEDHTVPLIERLRFLGIYSNNRDEFFQVRVATLKRMTKLGKKHQKLLEDDPEYVLERIQEMVLRQEVRVQKTFKKLISLLKQQKIHLVDDRTVLDRHLPFINEYFRDKIRAALVPVMLDRKRPFPFLKDRKSYLVIKLSSKNKSDVFNYALVEIPVGLLSRFIILPKFGDSNYIILLDDVIRLCLNQVFSIFEYDEINAYAIKVTRDAELDMDEDISKSLVDKLSKSVKGRSSGEPVRFIYDKNIPDDLLDFILTKMKLKKSNNLIASGRLNNMRDFMSFPDLGKKNLIYKKLPDVPHKYLDNARSMLDCILKRDIFLCYPYHNFNYIIDILREAAIDPNVEAIKISLYRVAKNSQIINALINAIKNGKKVLAVVELKARFDEEANISWAGKLQEEGVKVVFGNPEFKIHAKLILITKKVNKKTVKFAHVGTGNFNEKTAHIYTDFSLLTSNKKIANEIDKLFNFLDNPYKYHRYNNILVSPYTTRRKYISLIDKEIQNAQKGKEAYIILKLNNIVDNVMIEKLYEASQFGVNIKLIIRGICSLVPGVPGLSDKIKVVSIVDRFLEHSRIAIFCNDGDELQYISSADWMTRNLDLRIEVSAPVLDSKIKKLIRRTIDLQLKDNVKARIIDKESINQYKLPENKDTLIRSQEAIHKYLQNFFNRRNKA